MTDTSITAERGFLVTTQ